MVNAISRWRKKYALTLLIFVTGTVLAFKLGSSLGEYTAFCTLLLGVFGTQDLVDKKVANK